MVEVIEKAGASSDSVQVSGVDTLASWSPAQIDAQLAELDYQRFVLVTRQSQYRKSAADYQSGKRSYRRRPDLEMAAKMEAHAAELDPKIAAVSAKIAPLNAEFVRRGGWTRAFLVNNSNGHVHSSQTCSTCYVTTEFAWLTEFSDHSEDEIVAAAGARACCTCFPSAPAEVLARPTRIFTADEKAAQARKAEQEAKKAAAAQAAVVDPNTGKVLFRTERAANNEIARLLGSHFLYSSETYRSDAYLIAIALAAKQRVVFEKLFAAFYAKAEAKFRKEAIKIIKQNLAGKNPILHQQAVDPANWYDSHVRIAREEGLI